MAEDPVVKQDDAAPESAKMAKKKKVVVKATPVTAVSDGVEKKPRKRRRRRKKAVKPVEFQDDAMSKVVTEEKVSEPEVNEPEVVEPEVVQPEVVQPEVSEQEVSEPTDSDYSFQDEKIEKVEEEIVEEEEKAMEIPEVAVEPEAPLVSEPFVTPEPVVTPEPIQETPAWAAPADTWGAPSTSQTPEPIVEPPSWGAPSTSQTPEPVSEPPSWGAPVSPVPEVASEPISEPVGWGDTDGISDLGATPGVAGAAEAPSWFAGTTDDASSRADTTNETNFFSTPTSEPANDSVGDSANSFSSNEKEEVPDEPIQTIVQDVTSETSFADDTHTGSDKSEFMKVLEEAGIKKKHIILAVGIFASIVIAIFVLVFGYDSIFGGATAPEVTQTEVKTEVKPETKPEVTQTTTSTTPVVAVEPTQANFQISGLVNSYIFGLEFAQERVLPTLDTTPVSDEGSIVGIDSSLAAGQSLQFKQESIAQNLDLLLKIENAKALNLYEYLNKTTDRVAALNEHIRDLQVLLTQAQGAKNEVIAQINSLNTEYAQINTQRSVNEKAFFDSMNRYYGNEAFSNLSLFIESSQLQVKVKADYNALRSLNAMYDVSIKTLTPRINDIVANFDALVKGVQVTEVKNSNINAIKF